MARIRPIFGPISGRLVGSLVLLAGVLAFPAAARCEDLYTYSVGALGGVGGSPDVDSANYGNAGYQLNLGLVTEPRTILGLRVGRMSLDKPDPFGGLGNADLAYATIGGEYRFRQSYYDSGVYIALGAYRLRGREADGTVREQTTVGGALGLTGEFPVTRRVGVLVELSGHYANFSRQSIQFFAMGHAGVIVHF